MDNSSAMQPVFFAVRFVRALAIALWVGAMTSFAFLFAPVAFAQLGPTPTFAALVASVIQTMTRFGWGCALLAVLATLALPQRCSRNSFLLYVGLLLMSSLSLFEVQRIIPAMEHTTLLTPAYEGLHAQSSRVYGASLLIGIAVFGLSLVRDVGER